MKQNSKSRFYVFCATALALLILVGAFASDVVNNMNLGLDLRGGFEIAYEVSPLDEEHELPEMSVVVASIRKRIDVLGVNEPEIIIEGNEIDYEIPKLSGYYGYDAQWVKINKKWLYRLALFDLINNRPLAEAIEEKENYDAIKNLIFLNVLFFLQQAKIHQQI